MGMSYYQDLSDQVLRFLNAGDWDTAYTMIVDKANSGDAAATSILGEFYMEGVGVPEDLERGIELVEKAISMGCSEATEVLSGLFLQAKKVPIDRQRAFRYIEQGARMGHPAQMGKMAYTYLMGDDLPQDYRLALEWGQKAAKMGDFLGMITLAMIYDDGLGVYRDPSQAAYWYRQCLAQDPDDIQCMYRLAICLTDPFEEFGLHPSQSDYEEAFSLLSRGVEKGDLDCHMLIAWFYEMGHVVRQDYNTAYKYFKLAADHGHEPSKELIKRYRKNIFGNYYIPQ